jgi:hypothetical protein
MILFNFLLIFGINNIEMILQQAKIIIQQQNFLMQLFLFNLMLMINIEIDLI